MEVSPWRAYVERLGGAQPTLERATVDALWSEALGARPQLAPNPDAFGRALARAESNPVSRPGDLAIAAYALEGDVVALGLLDEIIRSQATRVAARSSIEADELAQRTRVRVLTGDPAALAGYQGRGSLGSWLRMVAGRIALDSHRSAARTPEAVDAFCDPIARSTPELRMLEQERRDRFVLAFRIAYRARTDRERTALKHYFVRGQTFAEMGRALGVHTSTAARWLTGARDAVMEDFHQALLDGVGHDGLGVQALLDALRSRLEIDPGALLLTADPGDPKKK